MAVSDLLHSDGTEGVYCLQKNIRMSLVAPCPVYKVNREGG